MTVGPPFKVEHLANFGTSEPWVARTMLGLGDLIAATPLSGESAITEALGGVFMALTDAFNDLRRLREMLGQEKPPPKSEIDSAFSAFYVHLWRAYKDRFQTFVQTLGFDIGFLWMNDRKFAAIGAKFLAKHPELDQSFIDMLADDRATWQSKVAYFRNEHLEHNKPLPPEFVARFYTLDEAELAFENTWQAIEDVAARLIETKLPPGVHLDVIPEDERDPGMPKRFRFLVENLTDAEQFE